MVAMQITDSDPERTRGDLDEIGVEPAVDSARSHAGKRPKYAGHLADLNVLHCDIIQDQFWDDRPWLLAS